MNSNLSGRIQCLMYKIIYQSIDMWVISAPVTLPIYMTMVEFIEREFVTEGFISCSNGTMNMCVVCEPEQDVVSWWPTYPVKQIKDDTDIDQPVTLEACMLVSMAKCDMIQTKNLKNMRRRIATRMGVEISDVSVVVDE